MFLLAQRSAALGWPGLLQWGKLVAMEPCLGLELSDCAP